MWIFVMYDFWDLLEYFMLTERFDLIFENFIVIQWICDLQMDKYISQWAR